MLNRWFNDWILSMYIVHKPNPISNKCVFTCIKRHDLFHVHVFLKEKKSMNINEQIFSDAGMHSVANCFLDGIVEV